MTLQHFLRLHRLTQSDFAQRIHDTTGRSVSQPAISRYLRGRPPHPEVAKAIIAATQGQVGWSDLYGEPLPSR